MFDYIGHCGSSEKSLIKDGELIFQSKSNDEYGDYHKDMDNNEFNKWIKEKIVPKFDKRSFLDMDNASYHNIFDDEDKIPNRNNEVRDWLTKNGVEF